MLSNIRHYSNSSCIAALAQTLNTKPLSSLHTSSNSESNPPALPAPQNLAEEPPIICSVVSRDSKWLAFSSTNATVQLWSRTSTAQHALKSHTDWVSSIAFSEDSRWLASASYNGMIHLRKIENNQPADFYNTLSCDGLSVSSMAFLQTAEVTQLAAGTIFKKIFIWSLNDQKEPKLLRKLSISDSIYQVSFSNDGQWLASSSNQFIYVYGTVNSFKLTDTVNTFFDATCITFSPDNLWLASGSTDGVIRLWSFAANQTTPPSLRYTFKGHMAAINCLVFSEDSKQLAATSVNNTFSIWSLDPGQSRAVIRHCSKDLLSVMWQPTLAQNPLLLTRGSDHSINLWEVETNGLSLHMHRSWTLHQDKRSTTMMAIENPVKSNAKTFRPMHSAQLQ
ncbi:WD40 repeat domain-containing protein [Mycoavidus sp. B2-EB]|uniref:WD40 repeat domain-containing protein n=1 Tax=Mycoavidus sp. B2-EB TaxID=2651972 RepID=UPI00162AE468|nr:PD40 domain-containing protein [Mycoavidus sp. B2-EB]BBO60273.1 hypothetical protein MPB2EB_1413 [Mycoavidus sp. B2-EB]